jgi:hypothetical protein
MTRLIWAYLRTLRRDNAVSSIRRAWRYYRASRGDGLSRRNCIRVALYCAVVLTAAERLRDALIRSGAVGAVPGDIRPSGVTWTAPGGQA